GNIYVGDTFNQTIRRITVAGGVGTVTTFAGMAGQSGSRNDTGTAATFNFPQGIVADQSGNLYVADTFNQTIRLINSARAVSTFAGTPGRIGVIDSQGNALFSTPRGVTIDGSGNLYVADTGNNIIRKITPQR